MQYSYIARDENGKAIKGVMAAETETELANRLSELGYILTRVRTTATKEATTETSSAGARLNQKDLVDFTIQLSTLINAGIPLNEGLKGLAADAEKENVQKVISDIHRHIEAGSSLKDALSAQPRSFSKLCTSIVGAGESTGRLDTVLNDLALMLEWQMDLKAKVKEASVYPIILFVVMIGVVALLVLKVIPTFEPIFTTMGANLPLPTQIVLSVSQAARRFWYVGMATLILILVFYKLYTRSRHGRYNIDWMKLKMPIFGSLLRKIALSRVCHTLSLALKSGVNLLSALDICKEVAGNAHITKAINSARESVNVGERLAASLRSSREFPPLVLRMIATGEESGTLHQSLNKVSQFYDKEVPSAIKKMFTLFEPMMIVIMGVVVGGIALSLFLPLFQMGQLIGR